MTSEYEIKPKRNAVEKVLSRLSIQTLHPKDQGTGGTIEISGAEFAGMPSNLPADDKPLRNLADRMAWAYLEYEGSIGKVVDLLDFWGLQRVLIVHRGISISGRVNRRIVKALVHRHVLGAHPNKKELRRAMGIGETRWPALMPWVADNVSRMNRADTLLHDHLIREIGPHRIGASCPINPTWKEIA